MSIMQFWLFKINLTLKVKTIGNLTKLFCNSSPKLVILAWTWCGQAQIEVKFEFQVKFDLEDHDQSQPKTIGTLTKVFCTSGPHLVILTWTGDELSRRQVRDWHRHADRHTHTCRQWLYLKAKTGLGNKKQSTQTIWFFNFPWLVLLYMYLQALIDHFTHAFIKYAGILSLLLCTDQAYKEYFIKVTPLASYVNKKSFSPGIIYSSLQCEIELNLSARILLIWYKFLMVYFILSAFRTTGPPTMGSTGIKHVSSIPE